MEPWSCDNDRKSSALELRTSPDPSLSHLGGVAVVASGREGAGPAPPNTRGETQPGRAEEQGSGWSGGPAGGGGASSPADSDRRWCFRQPAGGGAEAEPLQ